LKNTNRIASMPQRWLAAAIALLAVALMPAALLQAHAQRAEASESGVKAAFIYKFANYIEWPPSAFAAANTPLVIGVAGSDEIGAELERLVPGRTVNGHPLSVKRVKEGEPLRGVHVLFIGRDQGALAQLLRSAQQQSVLTVTDTERGLEMGSAINFIPAGERIAFEVSLDAAEKTGHKISSRMLSVARRVLPKSS
jgi:hypothetical protein